MKQLLILLGISIATSCSNHSEDEQSILNSTQDSSSKSVQIVIEDPGNKDELNGYNELSNDDSLDRFTISEYNTDVDGIENITRPKESRIINSKFPTDELFGIWVQDPGPDTPHATFELTEKSFYVVDYDGDGDMPYLIKGDSITVYYNDFITKGRIIESKNPEELTIDWNNSKRPTIYYIWKN